MACRLATAVIVAVLSLVNATAGAAADETRTVFGGGKAYLHHPRYHSYWLTNVKIVVSFDERKGEEIGDVTNSIVIVRPNIQWVDFDSADLHYSWVGVPGRGSLRYQTFGHTLRVFLPATAGPGRAFAIEARYTAHPTKGLYFVRPDASYPDRPWEVWSQSEMEDGRFWYPSYDSPDEKASSETVVTVPEGQRALSNGTLKSVTHDRVRHTSTWDWIMAVPHATYLNSIVAGTFVDTVVSHNGLTIQYWAPPQYAQIAAYDFRATPDMIDFFGTFNAMPYPYPKYAIAAVVDFTYGGMENISATTLTSRTLHTARGELDETSEDVTAHELSHQWFGDYETAANWGSAWLNEGFATYYTALYDEHAHGEDAFAMDRLGMMDDVFDQDREYRRPIVTQVYAKPIDMFDGDSYSKAGLVLHMLRTISGEPMYRVGEAAFLSVYGERSANTAQWVQAVTMSTGADIGWFADEWLYQAGFPEYTVSYVYDGGAKNVRLAVDQTQKTKWSTPAVFTMPVDIQITTVDGARTTFRVRNDRRHQVFDLPVKARPAMVLWDPGRNILAKTTFAKSDEEWIYQLTHADSVLDRLAAFDELAMRNKPSAAVTSAVASYIVSERVADARARAVGEFDDGSRFARYAGSVQAALHDRSAHVRAAAAGALSTFAPSQTATATLQRIAASDPSYMTVASAVETLADWHAPGIDRLLARALEEPSDHAEIASAALRGYATVEGKTAIALERRYARYGAPLDSRAAAIATLGHIGRGAPEVTDFLAGLLGDPDLVTNFTILRALTMLGDPRAIAPIRKLAAATEDERLRDRALTAADAIAAAAKAHRKASRH
ncbi:MAG TPA: M1 family aminopeptidase [Candidatus Eremiobacteraceae bacterium]|nr:M1 family aminopeptidase [Candidatus Eremiobacteraceae bacterium]